MQPIRSASPRRFALLALALSLAVLPGAAMSATAAPSDGPAAPSDVVATAALTPAADSMTMRVRWDAAVDALGEATMYTVTVRDSVTGATLAVNSATTTRELTFRLPAPAAATSRTLRVEVVARRRNLTSAPGVAHFRLSTADAPPPAPGGIIVDTLPIAPSSAILVGAGPGDECRPLVASVVGDVRSDTATFVRALDGMAPDDVHLYCVGVDLVVLLDGWTGDTERAPSIYGPGETLPLSRPVLDVGSARLLGA